jgi:NAD(P)-dependent dehydrogenase (short-subunit alcohol dehydrogenase family)
MVTDLDGVYLTFRRFVPGIIERRQGSLIAIFSMTSMRRLNRTPYAAAKRCD